MADMIRLMQELIVGVIAFVVVSEILAAVEPTETDTGWDLISLLVPLAIAIVVTLAAFRGLDRRPRRR